MGINFAAFCAAVEFGIQPLLFHNAAGQALYSPYPLSASIPAMLIPHLLVAGVVEVIFTVGIVAFIRKVSPGTIYEGAAVKIKSIYALLVAMIVLSPLGLLAAGTAWGEWGANEIGGTMSNGKPLGFIPQGMQHGFSFNALMPDYSMHGMSETVGYIVSAVAGAAILMIVFKIIASIKKTTAENAVSQ